MTENPQELVRYAALAIQCLTALSVLGSIIFGWIGYKKYAKPFAEPTSPKAEEMNNRDAGKTMLTIATAVLILSVLGSCLGFGLTFAIPTSPAAVTQTAPEQSQPDLTPQVPSEPAPAFTHMMPGTTTVTDKMHKTLAYSWMDITWSDSNHTGAQVYFNYSTSLSDARNIVDANNPLHEIKAWTSQDGTPWENIYRNTCFMANDVINGSLGTTNVTVFYTNGDGSYRPMNDIPSCSEEPLYKAP